MGLFNSNYLVLKICLKSKANKQELAKQKEWAKQSLLLVLKKKKNNKKQKKRENRCGFHLNNNNGGANGTTSKQPTRFEQTLTAEFKIFYKICEKLFVFDWTVCKQIS